MLALIEWSLDGDRGCDMLLFEVLLSLSLSDQMLPRSLSASEPDIVDADRGGDRGLPLLRISSFLDPDSYLGSERWAWLLDCCDELPDFGKMGDPLRV